MPTNAWKLTAAGRTALMDGANRQTRAIAMRTIAIGSGHGAAGTGATSARTALRNQRDSAAAGGRTATSGRIAVRADIAPTASYDVKEVGLFAQIAAEAPILFAYWTDGGRALMRATQGARAVVAGVIDLAGAAAEVAVTVSPAVTFAPVDSFVDLDDTPAALVAGNYLRTASPGGAAIENVGKDVVRNDLNAGLVSLVDAAEIAWNVTAAPNAKVVLGGNRTMAAPTGALAGGYYLLTVEQDAAGNRTLAWNAAYVFEGINFADRTSDMLLSAAGGRVKLAFTYEAGKMRAIGRVRGF